LRPKPVGKPPTGFGPVYIRREDALPAFGLRIPRQFLDHLRPDDRLSHGDGGIGNFVNPSLAHGHNEVINRPRHLFADISHGVVTFPAVMPYRQMLMDTSGAQQYQ
jgi:hypothetical protein